MKIMGIVAEYNPFHNGHLHHIESSRALTGCGGVVCVMSGNFVQRGSPAIADKWTRAEMALRSGADLVLELPVPYALSSAEGFAFGAVSALHALGGVHTLSFGAESEDLELLSRLADLFSTGELTESILSHLRSGLSFPAARSRAVSARLPGHEAVLKAPNNILAIEYLKALKKLKSPLRPLAVPRFGKGHHEAGASGGIASAGAIRGLIESAGSSAPPWEKIAPLVPESSLKILKEAFGAGKFPVLPKSLELPLLAVMRSLRHEDFLRLGDVGEGLENRLYRACRKSSDFEGLLAALQTKRYPTTRLSRILTRAFLGLDKNLAAAPLPYLRVLGLNETGRRILKAASPSLPVVTKPATAKALPAPAAALFAAEARATDLYALAFPASAQRIGNLDCLTSPVVLK